MFITAESGIAGFNKRVMLILLIQSDILVMAPKITFHPKDPSLREKKMSKPVAGCFVQGCTTVKGFTGAAHSELSLLP